jgi:hypothetical protein
MSRADRQRRVQEQREAGGETFTDVLRRAAGRPTLAIKVGLILVASTLIGMAVFEPPFELLPGWLIGIPWSAWLVRRNR